MSILERFSTIIKANINDLLDRAEDPAKMMDQYMRQLMSDLADVKRETASVMAEESRIQRQLEEKRQESAKNADLARRARIPREKAGARKAHRGASEDVRRCA